MTNVTGFRVDANVNPFEQSMRRLVAAARSGEAGVGNAMGGIKVMADGLRSAMAQLAIGFTAIQATTAFVRTADQVNLLNARLRLVTGSTEAATEAQKELFKVAQNLRVSYTDLVGTFARIMPAVAGLGGGVREATALSEILVSTARLSGASSQEAAASAQQFAQALGSGVLQGDELRSILENNQALARALAGALGLSIGELRKWGSEGKLTAGVVTNALLGQIDNIRNQTKDLPLTVGAAWTKVKNEFVDMVEEFEKGTGAVDGLAKTIDGVTPVVRRLTEEFSLGTKIFGGFWAAIAGAGFVSPFKDTGEQVASLTKDVEWLEKTLARYQSFGSDTAAVQEELKLARQRLTYFKELQVLEAKRTLPSGKNNDPVKGLGGGAVTGSKEPSQMPVFEAELSKRIALFEKEAQAQGTLRQFGLAQEAAYWQEVSTRAGVTGEDKARAEKKWRDIERSLRAESFAVEIAELDQRKQAAQSNYAERIAIAQQAHAQTVAMHGAESKEAAAAMGRVLQEKRSQAEQILQIDAIVSQRRRDKALSDVEMDRQDAQHKLALGFITQEQLLAQEVQFHQRMHEIKLQALLAEQATVDPQRDPVRKAEIDAQIEQLELQHQLRLKGLKDQVMQAQAGPELNMFSSMQTAFESATTGMIMQAQTLRQAMAGIFQSISAAFVQEMISKPLAMMAARVIRESAMYKFMAGAAISNQAAASGAVAGAKTAETAVVGGNNAVQAGTGAFAALAAIPVIGPALAAVAGPAMFATVMAMVARSSGGGGGSTTTTTTRIPSASGGFDIPKGLNPLTQLHEQEMVLPASLANPLRDQLAQGMGGQGGEGGGTVVINTTGGDFVHKRDLAKLLTTMKRDFRFQS